ncbi:Fucosyltransferase 12 isoform 2 [Hibiscus syriacus]|uniref:Fucosyltransferase n=1 Tax=Hibiscus syriacus TaxID=106335 RepID=A0A6A3A2R7_HIBSY|nr:Fucosyltransferase 12 isoform 2 [Hibiscus syriacus]
MGIISNLRGSRTQEGLPSSTSVSNRRKWSNLMPLVVALVVIAEISFLGRLDIAKNAAFLDAWPDMFHRSRSSDEVEVAGDQNSVTESCEEWLEREDAVVHSRNFSKDPIWVSGNEQVPSLLNSNEEDYVTEKFFQSLVAGTIPVVVGAPNNEDFAPPSGSVLHIKELADVQSVAKRTKYLAENPDAYNQS